MHTATPPHRRSRFPFALLRSLSAVLALHPAAPASSPLLSAWPPEPHRAPITSDPFGQGSHGRGSRTSTSLAAEFSILPLSALEAHRRSRSLFSLGALHPHCEQHPPRQPLPPKYRQSHSHRPLKFMSDHRHNKPQYLYIHHPQPIHSDPRRAKERAPALYSPAHAPQAHHLHPHVQYAQVPPYLLLHPFLQLARIDEVHQSTEHTPFPAVIVSPHSLSPPPQRDSGRTLSKKPPVKTAQAPTDTTDGHKDTKCSVPTSAPTMTSNRLPNMPSKRDDAAPQAQAQTQARSQRPSIVSQHSNSVPSTPLQVARKYSTRSRSPSPNGGLGSHSPRSVSSEANSTMPTLRGARATGCKFETNVGMLGRRRMPYQSDEILDKAKEEPKRSLDPHEEDKLSGDMRELYDRLLPRQEDTETRERFVKKVQRILEAEFPGTKIMVHVFGSSGNMLWTSESDVDICIQTPMKRLEEMHSLAEALDKHGMERVVCIPAAKVRIVKVWDPELQLSCDINVNNVAAIENTRMIKTYIQLDDRVRPLAMIIKYWTKRRILNDAGIGGTISSYTWICLILNFLQTRDPPVLPNLHDLPDRARDETTGQQSLSSFADDVGKLRGFGEKNQESLGQLLFHFFRLYGHEIDYEKETISVRQGKRIPREEKGWHPGGGQKEGVNRLCVEEPFNVERNLGNSADDYAWRGIHLEIRRAFDLLAEGQQLDKLCEQYEFPPEEKPNPIFKKPQSQKAIITSSVPNRNGRGGPNSRGGRGGFNLKGQHGGSRRSSGSSNYSQGRPQFLHSPPVSAGGGQEYFNFPRGIHDQLHDQLYQQYQMLEMQSNSLRAQLAAQQHAQQAHQVRAAQMHAHAVAQAQAQGRASNSTNGSPQKSPYVNGRQSPRLAERGIPPSALPQGFLYHYPGFYNQAQSDANGSQDGSRTNPSSPSLSNSMPGVHRGVHRASNASETNSLRSHSQPPRNAMQQPVIVGYPPVPPLVDPSAFAGYPIARSSQEASKSQGTSDVPVKAALPQQESVPSPDNSSPKEYVGYCVAEQPQPQPVRSLQDYTVPAIPSYSELAQRRRRVSPEITQPLLNTALRRVTRSPSPLGGHMRSYSTGVTQPNDTAPEQRKSRVDSVRPAPIDNGPVIVNGSFPAQPRPRGDAIDTAPPEALPQAPINMFANDQAIQQIQQLQARQQLVLQEMQRQKAVENMGPPIVNGSMNGHPSLDTNGLSRVSSENQQSFPALSDAWVNYDSANGHQSDRSEDISPTRTVPHHQWGAPAYTNGLPPLETTNVQRALPQEVKSATVPVLSPVYEGRTPSPTATRSSDVNKLVNGHKAPAKLSNQQHRPASITGGSNGNGKESRNGQQQKNSQGNERTNKSSGGGSSPNSWQQQPARKKGKNKKPRAPEQKAAGEPLPANAADRKGG
ncbi:Poly(A) RNA polymerase cid13 [Stemphylium lycopersici]|uniref:polynucleotide adenylyltransferase n=1 Tax=Stemphylium lycopersici TaxID=183478 RepID=A0A364N0P0_STELY|nr:Poly(A) RNA polymerase cid13 [Stemphylium lycopersici]RAR08702.1 Poly(A) RNA polymerase cid13 [Stemphylium lycopersici]